VTLGWLCSERGAATRSAGGGRRRKPSLGDLMELRAGVTPRAVSGVRSIGRLCSAIVLIAEVGMRRVVLATPGRIARVIVENLAPPCESIGGANERRKPDRGGKVARSVAGAACECGRSTCRY
jgi:hypothetical protein